MKNTPIISVVIPTYNRPKSLKKCLEALLKQDMQVDWEIIVIDDGSEADLKTIIDSLNHEGRIQYHKQLNQGPATARNKGVSMAKGEFIAFIDDDCMPQKEWLQEHLNMSQEGVIVGGKTINSYRNNLLSESSQVLIDFLYLFFKNSNLNFYTSNNFSMDKKTFLEVGGFDESFPTSAGEDRELCVRWLHLGYELAFNEKAVIEHYHFLNFKNYCKLHFKYGTAAVPFRQKMKKIGVDLNSGQSNFYNKLAKYPFKLNQYNFLEKTQIICFLGVSQIANILGHLSIRFAIKK